jgi:hypothetical protein
MRKCRTMSEFISSPGRRERDSKKPNGNEYSWLLRALLVAMDRWVYDGIAPPPSAHPQLADKTLVPRDEINFPALGKGNKQHSVAGALINYVGRPRANVVPDPAKIIARLAFRNFLLCFLVSLQSRSARPPSDSIASN